MGTMQIGSGSVVALMSGRQTKTHQTFLRQFVSGIKPVYNAYASPIDACRAGQILEDRFAIYLGDEWYSQNVVICKEMDVFKASLDFSYFEGGELIKFKELKTKSFNDFLAFEKMDDTMLLKYVKTKDKKYYNQIQEQLMCTGLKSATLTYLVVYTYEDEINYKREIKDNEIREITIERDEERISKIKEAGLIYQQIKDTYKL